ncbi:glycosyltransferase family 4 protein [Deinococcus deserti]|uniref:Putative glycosyltransferase, putative phosphatidylinositol alpha-mannosyltransferase n=1 Tax=Deinococcus deserti (strain DSM 17065 / CIP 109153 / LMG 22923 / VCD115) TaxID=546414 RepID=C1CY69_DEIDV|nr:glycosyltransferase family 4 protein [Deinococcus deserti]ACO47025.1 putative glycosyltransferase, putative phosphatidylinositol alpha-mannosyltransferase [Deinococcus deserti VCD115]
MRVGIVTATYLPSRNGVATSTALFARGLRERGHEVRIFAPRHPQMPPHEEGVYRLNSSFAGARALGAPADYPVMLAPGPLLTSRLPLRDLDVLHTMHPFLAGQLARTWSRLSGAPVVYTAHTQYEQYLHYAPVPKRVSRAVVRPHVAAFARRVDAVLAPGRAMVDMLREYGYGGHVELFPNPVDLGAFRAAQGHAFRAEFHVAPDAPLVMYLGRLAPEKNLNTMLRAFDQARASRPELRLLVVGDGPSRATAQLTAPEGVTFTGPVPYSRVPEALAAADVFLTASTSEVLPMSMIEALAAGAPLVAARSPAALDLIQEGVNGTVRDATHSDLASGLLQALSPEVLPVWQTQARHSAAQYDLQSRAADLEAVYERVRARPMHRNPVS